jgi:hypothetical protein
MTTSTETARAVDAMSSAELLAGVEDLAPPEEQVDTLPGRTDDFTDLLELFKQRRRDHVRHLARDDEHTTAAVLADIQNCIAAIEAVMAETPPKSPWDDPAFSLAR